MAPAIVTAALLLWSVFVVVVDGRRRKVPNALLLPVLVVALAALVWQGEGLLGSGWQSSGIGMAVAFALTLPGYALSKLGAGDVKLAAVIGGVLGWPLVVWALVIAALTLGLASLVVVSRVGLTKARVMRIPAALYLLLGFAATLLVERGAWL